MDVLPACSSAHHMPLEENKRAWGVGTRVGITSDLGFGSWELSLAPLEENPMLLITKPSPQQQETDLDDIVMIRIWHVLMVSSK